MMNNMNNIRNMKLFLRNIFRRKMKASAQTPQTIPSYRGGRPCPRPGPRACSGWGNGRPEQGMLSQMHVFNCVFAIMLN